MALDSGVDINAVRGEERSLADARPGNWLYDTLTMGAPTYTGRSVNAQIAMTYSAVYACVSIRAEAVAMSPLVTYRNTMDDKAGTITKTPAYNDYRYRMLAEQPNPEMTSFQWREIAQAHIDLLGNSYNWLDWDSRGHLRAIWPLRPDWVVPMRNENGRLVYRYMPLYYYSSPVPAGEYEDWQILHIPGLGFDGTVGYSPITMARQAIGMGLGYEEFGGRFFANNARPNILLTTPTTIDDPAQVKAEWTKNYGGLDNSGKVGILHGAWDVKQFSINPKDAQFLEGRMWQLAEIARWYKVPLQMLADWMGKSATFASAEQFDIGFVKHTILPCCRRIEGKIDITVLGSQDSLTCKHDTSDLASGDMETQANTYGSFVRDGIMKRNEARHKIGLNPSDNPAANELTVQMQEVPLGTPPVTKTQPPGKPAPQPEE